MIIIYKDYSMKKILLLGGSAQQVIAIETARRLGLYTVLCDYLTDNPGQYVADKFYLVSTTDKDAVLDVAKQEQISGILAYASDPAAPTAAYVAAQLGLPGNPYESVETLCNKDRFREFLSTHDYNSPRAKGYECLDDVLLDIESFSFPIIIKPVDSSGSKGVTVVRNRTGIRKAVEFAFASSRSQRIIVEEFIEKKHKYLIGGDIFVLNGRVVQWGLMNCHRDSSVNALVPVGKSYPVLIDDYDLELAKETLQRLVDDLNINFGPMNVELIVDNNDRVFLIDIGPRSGGNMIPDLLSMIFNCDVVEMCVKVAMGEAVDCSTMNETPYLATYNLHSNRDGRFERIDISSKAEKYIVKKRIYKKKGDEVHYFSNASDALGIVFLRFQDGRTMYEMEDTMNQFFQVVLEQDR